MKKLLLIAAIAVSAFSASAQTEQGNIVLGGAVQFDRASEDTHDLTILPSSGYFVNNNVAIGTAIGYAQSKFITGKNEAFKVSPFGRVYKDLGTEQFKFFGELSVPLEFGTVKNSAGNKVAETTAIGVSLSPGFAFFPTKKFGIELGFNGVSYLNTTTKPEVGGKSSNDTFSIGADFFNPKLGFQFYF